MEKVGWLKKQLEQAEQEIRDWPKWKRDSESPTERTRSQSETNSEEKQKRSHRDKD